MKQIERRTLSHYVLCIWFVWNILSSVLQNWQIVSLDRDEVRTLARRTNNIARTCHSHACTFRKSVVPRKGLKCVYFILVVPSSVSSYRISKSWNMNVTQSFFAIVCALLRLHVIKIFTFLRSICISLCYPHFRHW